MSSTESGQKAELAASVYLEMRGYKVLERNWRRPRCEIDIVALKDDTLHFVEVEYRRTEDQSGGFATITATKVKQLKRSAWMYVEENEWPGEYVLSSVEVGGPNYSIMSFIEGVF